jgi:hypothetical protein
MALRARLVSQLTKHARENAASVPPQAREQFVAGCWNAGSGTLEAGAG